MATSFKQVENNAKSHAVSGDLNNVTDPVTFSVTSGEGSRFPSPGNGFWVTVWDDSSYVDPFDDANMEIMLVTSRTTDSLTASRAQLGTSASSHSGTPAVRLLIVDQHLDDIHAAVNTIENALPTGAIVGTTDTQTLSNKTFSDAVDADGGVQVADAQDIAFDSGAKIERDGGDIKVTPESGKDFNVNGYLSSSVQPLFKAYLTADQSVPSGSETTIEFNATEIDQGNNFDTSTNYRFDVPVDGVYLFLTQIRAQIPVNEAFQVHIVTNSGVEVRYDSWSNNNAYDCKTAFGLITLSSGDWVTVDVYHTKGSAADVSGGSGGSFFCGFKVF